MYRNMRLGRKQVISRALGMLGIYCTSALGRKAPSCFGTINAIHPSRPWYNYYIITWDIFFAPLLDNHLRTDIQQIELCYNDVKNLTSILSCRNDDKVVVSKETSKIYISIWRALLTYLIHLYLNTICLQTIILLSFSTMRSASIFCREGRSFWLQKQNHNLCTCFITVRESSADQQATN